MSFRRTVAVLGLLAAIVASPAAEAKKGKKNKAAPPVAEEQAAATPAPSAVPPELELQQIFQQLTAAHDRAMQDPDMIKEHEALQTAMQQAFVKADPKFEQKVARLQAIVGELEAKVNQEGADVAPLLAEGQQLQNELQAVQTKVTESEPMVSAIADFDTKLRAKMTQIDPKTPMLMERADVLVQQLNAAAPQS